MPIYVYRCSDCEFELEEYQGIHDGPLMDCVECGKEGTFNRVPTVPHTDMKEYHKPIEMNSIGMAHEDEIRAFQIRNPGVKIETNPSHPEFGVPIAHTRKEKLEILKREGYVERK